MDILSIPDPTEWDYLLKRARKGEVKKQEVIDLLRSGEPVPPDAAALVADILDGTFKCKSGAVQKYTIDRMLPARSVLMLVRMAEDYIRHPEKAPEESRERFVELNRRCNLKRARTKTTPNKAARQLAAEILDCSPRRIKTITDEAYEYVDRLAAHLGITKAQALDLTAPLDDPMPSQ